MKRITIIITILLINCALQAQDSSYLASLSSMATILNQEILEQSTFEEFAKEFEQMAQKEQNQWLPYYYAAYCTVSYALELESQEEIGKLALKAQNLLNKADSLAPKNSEISCIKSLIATAFLISDPMAGGYKYGTLITSTLNDAEMEDPTNPRVYYLQAQSLMYMPPQYGGGYEKAKVKLEEAMEKFESFNPEKDYYPNWGKQQSEALLKGSI